MRVLAQKVKIFAFIVCLITLAGCHPGTTEKNPASTSSESTSIKKIIDTNNVGGGFSSQTQLRFDSSEVDQFFNKYDLLKKYQSNLRSFYRNRNFAFAWFDNNGMIEQAGNLYNRIISISNEGLQDSIPYRAELDGLMEGASGNLNPSTETDLMLTSQYFLYAKKTYKGINEKQLKELGWFLPRKKLPLDKLLDSLLGQPSDSFLVKEPVYKQYAFLRNYLKKYRDIQAAEKWESIFIPKKKLEPGDSAPNLAKIRHRLFLLGDLPDDSQSQLFDSILESGIREFQARNGLSIDGSPGASTIREMNVPLSERIKRISINMERSRWLPIGAEADYIVVNIPEFKLHVFEKGSDIWDMKVVVGQELNKTVIFKGDIKLIVFSPYWNIPASIVKKEVLPGMKKNHNYLKNHNMEITGYSDGVPAVRQKPGPNNSLGLVKFLFPNSHNIYMHDSPAKSLFNETSRAFSHGCIRLAEPSRLANYLLRDDESWTKEKIITAMHSGKEKYVTLKRTEPVYIAYFTAWVDSKGKLNFRNDIYKRDTRLASMLFEGATSK